MSWSHTITARTVANARDALKTLVDDILPADADQHTKEQVAAAASAAGFLLDDYHEDEFVALNMYGHAEAVDDDTGLHLRPTTSVAVAIGQRTEAEFVPLPVNPAATANEATGPQGVAGGPTTASGYPIGPVAGEAGATTDAGTAPGASAAPATTAAEAAAAGLVNASKPAIEHADELGVDITQVKGSGKDGFITKPDVAKHAATEPPVQGGATGPLPPTSEQPVAGAAGATTDAGTGLTAPGTADTTPTTTEAASVAQAAAAVTTSGDKAQIAQALADVDAALAKWPDDAGLKDAKAQLEAAQAQTA